VRVGPRCSIDRGLTLEASGIIDIGADTVFGHHCTIAARASVIIGHDCLIGELVSIRDHDHASTGTGVPMRLQGHAVARVRIGNDVWLGAKVTVLKGVTIGDGAIVGANAVVTSDIPSGAVAVGIPARVIKIRSDG
jgi:acetyltransferase-like isoleucine patch superfamily enzyme